MSIIARIEKEKINIMVILTEGERVIGSGEGSLDLAAGGGVGGGRDVVVTAIIVVRVHVVAIP